MKKRNISCDIITASNGDIERCRPFLVSLASQTCLPESLIVLLYPETLTQSHIDHWLDESNQILWSERDGRVSIFRSWNSDFDPWKWIWYDRQFRLSKSSKSSAEYCYLLDDDNEFEPNFLEKSFLEIEKLEEEQWANIVYAPTVRYADSKKIQSQWVIGFSWWKPQKRYFKKKPDILDDKQFHEVIMIWGNALLWKKSLFMNQWFDSRFTDLCEDIDVTYWLYLQWTKIFVSQTTSIFHTEVKSSILEEKFLSTNHQAKMRGYSRVIFASKHASAWGWIQYVRCGVWMQTVWFLFLMIGSWLQKKELTARMSSLLQGTFEWLKEVALEG